MAAATVVDTEWGHYVTGGTDATTIYTGRARIQAIAFTGAAADDTCTLTTTKDITGAATSFLTLKSIGTAGYLVAMNFPDGGVPADSMAVTLSNTGGKLWVYRK